MKVSLYINIKSWFVLCLLLLLLYIPKFSTAQKNDSLLNALSQTIKEKEVYLRQKNDRLDLLRGALKDRNNSSPAHQFDIYNTLYQEYRAYKYDSAFAYVLKLRDAAEKLNDPHKMHYAKLQLGFILLSSGMFKEALDSLNTVNSKVLSDSLKADYFALKARAYFDLTGYNQDTFYSPKYRQRGEAYIDSALALLDENTFQFRSLRGMRYETSDPELAKNDFQLILNKLNPTLHQYAIAANSLGTIYENQEDLDKAIELRARSAIADIKASTREAFALMQLAQLLYHKGDENRAYVYIKHALEDATFYGSKLRKIQVAAILPIIEGERLATVEAQRTRLYIYAVAVTLLSLLVVTFAFIIFRQLKQLKLAKRTITEANQSLQQINDDLVEANKIKEEYIGYSFNMYSDSIDKLEKFKKAIDKKLMSKKYDEIGHVMKSVNLKKEREELYLSFDKIFLKLFPNFVPAFNSYFKEEDKFIPKDKDSLNIELRIFALIRIGINDHEQIAKILEYSVNTIYTYKTRVKNRSVLPNEEFEDRIMEIKAF